MSHGVSVKSRWAKYIKLDAIGFDVKLSFQNSKVIEVFIWSPKNVFQEALFFFPVFQQFVILTDLIYLPTVYESVVLIWRSMRSCLIIHEACFKPEKYYCRNFWQLALVYTSCSCEISSDYETTTAQNMPWNLNVKNSLPRRQMPWLELRKLRLKFPQFIVYINSREHRQHLGSTVVPT